MNRKAAIIIIFTVIFIVGFIDILTLMSSSGTLNKLAGSISKFDTIYSQTLEMKRQLLTYSSLLNSKRISLNNLKIELLKLIPNANFKVSGDTISLQSPVNVDPYSLINLMGQFTNVNVVEMKFRSNSPIFYEYKNTNQQVITNYSLDLLVVRIYGG